MCSSRTTLPLGVPSSVYVNTRSADSSVLIQPARASVGGAAGAAGAPPAGAAPGAAGGVPAGGVAGGGVAGVPGAAGAAAGGFHATEPVAVICGALTVTARGPARRDRHVAAGRGVAAGRREVAVLEALGGRGRRARSGAGGRRRRLPRQDPRDRPVPGAALQRERLSPASPAPARAPPRRLERMRSDGRRGRGRLGRGRLWDVLGLAVAGHAAMQPQRREQCQRADVPRPASVTPAPDVRSRRRRGGARPGTPQR